MYIFSFRDNCANEWFTVMADSAEDAMDRLRKSKPAITVTLWIYHVQFDANGVSFGHVCVAEPVKPNELAWTVLHEPRT